MRWHTFRGWGIDEVLSTYHGTYKGSYILWLTPQARRLPSALHKRVRDYFAFQHKKRRQDDSSVAAFLPHTLRVSISSHLYGHLLRRNRFLFGDCNPQFSTMLLMELREVFIMPGGIIFHMGDMARELCFVTDGVVEKVKDGKVNGGRLFAPPKPCSESGAALLS